MFEINRKVPFAFAVLALMLCGSLVLTDASADTGGDLTGYGSVNEIQIAPGYSWSYTSTFAKDLEDGTVMSLEVNELPGYASVSGHTLKIDKIAADLAGNSYNIVLKAYHEDSDQTAYQWIRVTVNSEMKVSCTGCINEIIKGTSQTIDLKSEGGIGTVTWKEVQMPDGLTLNGSTVSGTPTKVGANKIVLKATSSRGETKDLTIDFTVFNVIVGGSDEKMAAIGGIPVSSTAVEQTGDDLEVVWTADKSLPSGLTLNKDTGVISGTYDGTKCSSVTITLTGTPTHGPAQTATKKVAITYEPAFTLADVDTVLTYVKNPKDVTSSAMVPSTNENTEISYTMETPVTGVTVAVGTGVLTFTGSEVEVTDGGVVTVVATTELGQVVKKDVSYIVEDTLTITGPEKLNATAGKAAYAEYTITGGSSNTVALSDTTLGDGLTFKDGKLCVSYPRANGMEKVTIEVTSAAGQLAPIGVDVTVYSALGFDSEPTAKGIFAYAG